MPISDAQRKANAKYSKENYQHISFKARIGSRDRIIEAAKAKNQSVNAFIKTVLSNAVMEAIGKTLEPTDDEFAKIMMIRILSDALTTSFVFDRNKITYKKIEANLLNVIESTPELYKDLSEIVSSDLSARDKKKAINELGQKKFEEMKDVIIDMVPNY